MESNYALIMGRGGSERTGMMLTINVEGERALPVFETVEAAEDFRLFRGLDAEWSVVDDPDGLLGEYLRLVVAPHVHYVALDPPAPLKGGDAPAIPLIPIERFLEDC
jgi:hypothetical protein